MEIERAEINVGSRAMIGPAVQERCKRAKAMFGRPCGCGKGEIVNVTGVGDAVTGRCVACAAKAGATSTARPAPRASRVSTDAIVRTLPCVLCGRSAKKMTTRGAVGVCAFCCLLHGSEAKALDVAAEKLFEDAWARGR